MHLQELQNKDSEQDTGCLQAGGHIILVKDAPGSTHTVRLGQNGAAKVTWQREGILRYLGTSVTKLLKRCLDLQRQ